MPRSTPNSRKRKHQDDIDVDIDVEDKQPAKKKSKAELRAAANERAKAFIADAKKKPAQRQNKAQAVPLGLTIPSPPKAVATARPTRTTPKRRASTATAERPAARSTSNRRESAPLLPQPLSPRRRSPSPPRVTTRRSVPLVEQASSSPRRSSRSAKKPMKQESPEIQVVPVARSPPAVIDLVSVRIKPEPMERKRHDQSWWRPGALAVAGVLFVALVALGLQQCFPSGIAFAGIGVYYEQYMAPTIEAWWVAPDAVEPSRAASTCFVDTEPMLVHDPETDAMVVGDIELRQWCDDGSVPRPCPEHGQCRAGQLIGCESDLWQVYDNQCVLSSESNATLAAMAVLVHEWTVDHVCGGTNPYVVQHADNKMPLFEYSQVSGEVGYNLALVQAANETFQLVVDGDHVLIGLQPTVALELSPQCRAKWMVLSVFKGTFSYVLGPLLSLFWQATLFILSVLVDVFWEAPLQTLLVMGALVFIGGCVYRNYAANRIKREKNRLSVEAATVEDAVMDLLRSNHGTELRALAVREAVWPRTGLNSRSRYHAKVWPKVERRIRADHRVRNRERTEQDRVVLFWCYDGPREQ